MGTRTFKRKCELGSECSVLAPDGPAEAGLGNPRPNSLLKETTAVSGQVGECQRARRVQGLQNRTAGQEKGAAEEAGLGCGAATSLSKPLWTACLLFAVVGSYPPSNLSCFLTPFPPFFSLLQILLSHPLKC